MATNKICCFGIIVAAGRSTRMSMDLPKQFLPLCGVPAIVRTLQAFDDCRSIDSVAVVCRKEHMEQMKKYIGQYRIRKKITVTEGGETRQESVAAGIAAAPARTEYYAIHDGARPLVTAEEIDSAVKDAVRYGAGALAVPVKDTVKVVGPDGFVVSTPERSSLWAVQTPQVFEREMYLAAMEQAARMGADYTDDCQLVEHAGARVHLVRGAYSNIKLTTPEDIAVCEAILQQRENTK